MTLLAFQYQAIDGTGSKSKGVVQARDRDEALRQLTTAGLRPIRLAARRGRGRNRRVTTNDLARFTYQFATLMRARIPIVEGLRSLAEQEQKDRFREVLIDVSRQIEVGGTLVEALNPHRWLFGEVYVETIRAAEHSGNIVEVLDHLAEMLEQQAEMRANVKSALIYPICVIVALALALCFLMTFVVPRFATMFASRGIDLPFATRLIIGISNVITGYWYVLLAIIVSSIWYIRRMLRDRNGRRQLDSLAHYVPVLRTILRGLAISRFISVLGISLRSGISLIDAIDMSGRACGRPLLEIEASKLKNHINVGGRLSDVIFTCQYLPAFTQRMMAAGEEAGELPKMCEIITGDLDREVTRLTGSVTTIIEPILVVGLAGVVLVIALAIFLPMWSMASLIS